MTAWAQKPARAGMWIILAVCLLSVWQSALFFTDKQKPVLLMLLLACAGVFLVVRPPIDWRDKAIWGLAALLGGYVLALPFAARPSGAQHGLGMLFASLLMFLIGRISAHAKNSFRQIALGFSALSAGIVVSGLLMLGKVLPYVDGVLAGRVGSFFQYANTFAVFSAMGVIAGVSLLLQEDRFWPLWHVLITVNLSGVLLSGSRALLLLVPVFLLALALAIGRAFWRQLPALLLDGLIALALQMVIGRTLSSPQLQGFWVIPIGLVGWAVTYFTSDLLRRIQARVQIPRAVGIAAIVLGIAAIAVVALRGSTGIAARLATLRMSDPAIIGRIYTLIDGLRIVVAHPLGIGSDGWRGTYFAFASYNYVMNAAHSLPVDVAVSGGFLALAGLVWFWGVLAVRAWRRLWQKPADASPNRVAGVALALAVVLATLHAVIDWDMAFGMMLFVYWFLIGVVDVWAEPQPLSRPTGTSRSVVTAVIAVFVVSAALQVAADNRLNSGTALAKDGKLSAAILQLRSALSLEPWNSFAHHNLALAVVRSRQPNDPQAAAEAEKEFQLEMRYDKYAYTPRLYYGQYLESLHRWEDAEKVMTEAVKLGPWRSDTWANLLSVYVKAAEEAAPHDDTATVSRWVKAGQEVVAALQRQIDSQPAFTHYAQAMQFDSNWPELVQFQERLKQLGAGVP